METPAHLRLKHLAIALLRERGCRVVASEVRCPIARWRVDVAGFVDVTSPAPDGTSLTHDEADFGHRNGRRVWRCPGRTVLVECKQSRQDFLRDRREMHRLLLERQSLDQLRVGVEEKQIKRHEPQLRRAGSSLFPEMEDWDFSASRLPSYRDLLRRLRRLDRMIHGDTKFCMMARYGLADRLYLATPRGLLKRCEIPPGWGLLECPRRLLQEDDLNADLFGESLLHITVPAPHLVTRDTYRQRWLRNIAVAASAAASKSMGILA